MSKLKFSILALLFVAVSQTARADVIYGTIYSKALEARSLPIEIVCGDHEYEGKTGSDGEYRVFVDGEKKCTLRVILRENSLTAEVRSYLDEPVRYDFLIVKDDDGYRLVRD